MSLLTIHNLSLHLPGVAKPILQNINYEVTKGDFTILLGANGSGKSSLLKTLDRRYLVVNSGAIKLAGKNINNYSNKEFYHRVISITQHYLDTLFPNLTVLENCALANSGITSNLRQFFTNYLAEYNQELKDKLDIKVNRLSGGEQQALVLALAVLAKPQLLLLDEHTSALDPIAATRLMEITAKIIYQHNITCILCTHDLNIAINYGNRILILQQGKIFHTIEPKTKTAITIHDLLKIGYV